jgi:hypothetical protein
VSAARHLSVVRAADSPRPAAIPVPPAGAVLKPHAEHDLDQAELFLLGLADKTEGVGLPRAMYLLGLAEGHLANLVELVRAVTS